MAIELIEGRPPWFPLGQRKVVELIRTVGTPPLPLNISLEFENWSLDFPVPSCDSILLSRPAHPLSFSLRSSR